MGRGKLDYKRAVALGYDALQDQAPVVNALGDALSADELVRLAKRFGVPVVENAPLAQALSQLAMGQRIPQSLYRAVAIILNQLEQSAQLKH